MSESSSRIPVPGWYQDPLDSHRFRWWDGHTWTEHIREVEPSVAVIPPPVPEYLPFASHGPVATSSSGDTAATFRSPTVNTPWVWLIALSPVWVGIITFVLGIAAGLTSFSTTGVPSTSSGGASAIPAIAGLLCWILLVVFAGQDRSALLRAGHPTAASTWWMLLFAPIAYLIARRVTVKRWTGRGAAPGNVFALLYLVPILLVVAAIVLISFASAR